MLSYHLKNQFYNDPMQVINGLVTLVIFGIGGTVIKEKLSGKNDNIPLSLVINKRQAIAVIVAKLCEDIPEDLLYLLILFRKTEVN